jgi:hypothetical protein
MTVIEDKILRNFEPYFIKSVLILNFLYFCEKFDEVLRKKNWNIFGKWFFGSVKTKENKTEGCLKKQNQTKSR